LKPDVPPTGSHGELPFRLIDVTLASGARNSPDGPDFCEITRALNPRFISRLARSTFCQRPDSIPPERRFQVPRNYPGLLESAPDRSPKPPSLKPSRTLETNLTNLPRVARFCQC